MSTRPVTTRKFFINREFAWYVWARIIFIAGIRMTPVLLGWKLYEITGSKLSLGILGLSEVIPAILLALPAGVKVDLSNKQRLISFCIALYLFIMVLMLLVTSDYFILHVPMAAIEWSIYLLVCATGAVRAYSSPAFNSFLAQLVKQEELVRATSLNSMAWLMAAVAGPAIGGLLLGYTNITIAFTIVCGMVLLSLLLMQKVGQKPVAYDPGKIKTWDSVKEGLHFVMQQKALLGSMTLDMFAVLFGGAVALLPVFAKDILHVGPQGLGWLMAATYLGNFVAIAFLTWKPMRSGQGKKLFYVVAGFGICILIFALSKSFLLSFAALFISGLFDGVSVIIRGTVLQLFVPNEMRGRVSSVSSIFINSSNELGQFESGVAASIMGTVPSVVFGGCMTLLVVMVTWFKAPALRKLEY
ncbi:MAG TPA: MFS transporter [Lacibacter sp.]|nr:MFS transporter [Lacibacter sp.]